MSSAFARIKWSVFEDISTILVEGDEGFSGAGVKPFISHPIAAEAASEIPLEEIRLSIDVLDDYEGLDYEAPDAVVIRGKDGGIVTVGDVVEQLAPHFIAHKKDILFCKAPMLNIDPWEISMNHKVFFHQFLSIITPGLHAVRVDLWAEGELGWSIETVFC